MGYHYSWKHPYGFRPWKMIDSCLNACCSVMVVPFATPPDACVEIGPTGEKIPTTHGGRGGLQKTMGSKWSEMNWENPWKNGRIPKNKWNVAEKYMEWVSLTYCTTKWVEFVSPFIFGDFGPTLQCEHLNNYYTSRCVSINDMFFRHLFQKKVATPDLCRRSLLVFCLMSTLGPQQPMEKLRS